MRALPTLFVLALAACASTLPAQVPPQPTRPSQPAQTPAQTPAQQAVSARQAEAEVLAVVNRLWEAMRTNDSSMARSVFDSSARMVRIVNSTPNGARSVRWDSAGGFVRAIGTAKTPWIERMVHPQVRVDQNLASVWTWYDFTVNGAVSHCGYDSIELVKFLDGWKIIYIADTRQATGCEAPRVPG